MLLERTGEKRKAARVYKDVLTIAPPEEQVAAELRALCGAPVKLWTRTPRT